MAKVVAFMDEGRSHGNDLTAALLPPATAPAQEEAAGQSPPRLQQQPAPLLQQEPPALSQARLLPRHDAAIQLGDCFVSWRWLIQWY